ncbi:MAG: ATP-binding protein [Burkholderiales bacterium]
MTLPAALRTDAPQPAALAPAPDVPAATSRYATRYLERASLQARLHAKPAPGAPTRIDTASVMAALAQVLVPDASDRLAASAGVGAAVRRMLTPLPGGRLLAVDVVPATVAFDGAELARVLQELVDNARRHAPAGSTVRVRGAAGANGYQLSVTNTGDPLPRWVLAALRPGRGGATTTDPSGHALGLSIASMLSAAYGTRLEVLRGAGRPNTLRIIVPQR